MIGLIGRSPTVVSIFEFARQGGGGLNLYSFFQLSVKPCPGLENSYLGGCDNLWLEDHYQGAKDQNRTALSHVLAATERKVADYVGYWPGPKYIENERHFMSNWSKIIRTEYSRVPATGTRRRPLLFTGNIDGSGSVPMTREFIQMFNPYFGNVIRYRFGEVGTSLNLPDNCTVLLYPEGTDALELSSGDQDPEKTINEAYQLRPFIVVERTDEFLTVDVPLVAAVKPELYFEFPDIRGNVRAINACSEDNFVSEIAVYGEVFEKPDGYVKIAKRLCNRCGGSGCDGCDLPELPVCLIPVSSEKGLFQVRPIRNTAAQGETPCWIIDDLDSCCAGAISDIYYPKTFDLRFVCDTFCTKPLELCINYISSCNNCFGDDCLDRMICPELLDPIAKITLADLPVYCDCDCFREVVMRLRDDWPLRGKGFSRGLISEDQYQLGMKVGHVEAWIDLKNVKGRHQTPMLGMVG